MAPHPDRKHLSLPRLARRGHALAPAKNWKLTPLAEPFFMSGTNVVESVFPFTIFEEPTRNFEDVGRGVAHKLRSGLCALKGGLELSLQQMLPGPTREMLSLAERGAQHITEIVKDLVQLTQRPDIHPKHLDLNLLIGEFLNGLRRDPAWHHVALTRRMDGSIPLILADPALLDTVFESITKNALEAMIPSAADSETKTPAAQLLVQTAREEGQVAVRLIDSGTGLSPDAKELAFQPYFSTKSGHRGMGLALA
nr:HAMP domain-containing histidine kinase [Elusimicrobiota bacterium]